MNTPMRTLIRTAVCLLSVACVQAAPVLSDDFSGTSLDGSKWTTSGTNATNSFVTVGGGNLRLESWGDAITQVNSADDIPVVHTMEMTFRRPDAHNPNFTLIRYGTANTNYSYYVDWSSDGRFRAYSPVPSWGLRSTSAIMDVDTDYRLVIENRASDATVNLFQVSDNSLVWDTTFSHLGMTDEFKFNMTNRTTTTPSTDPLVFLVDEITIIPEPGSVMLLLLGFAALVVFRHKALRA